MGNKITKLFKKKSIIYLLGLLVLLIGAFVCVYCNQRLKDKIYINYYVNIKEDKDIGDNIYSISNKKHTSMWNLQLQDTITQKINKKAQKASFDDPLIVYNPYGTNTCAVNVYYTTKNPTNLRYTISVDNEEIPDFTQLAYCAEQEGERKHKHQLIGLVPNELNTITLQQLDENETVLGEYTFTIKMGSLKAENAGPIETIDGESKEELSNGLFAILGLDKAFNSNIFLYDNDGYIRSELPLKGYRTDHIFFIEDTIVYAYDNNKIAFVNRLGEIVRKFNIGNYEMHHDFIYDDVNRKILILVNEFGSDTMEDVVISLDLKDGKVTKLLDMKDLMLEAKNSAVIPEQGNTYGGNELDWIHLNTIDCVNGKDLILSSREFSTIIRVNNVYEQAELAYFIADESVWTGTKYESLLLKKDGDFISQAGQHAVTYLEDDTLAEGQYYIYMFNNNYKGARTRPNFDWSAYKGAGTFDEGDHSYFYQYLIDEVKGTYMLVKNIPIPYSSIVSSVEYYKDHIVTGSGRANCYNEYDKEGKMIRQFNYESEKYAYRVFKYSFESFWFK